MSELLDAVITAHGGLDRWNAVRWRSGHEMDEPIITTHARSTRNAYKWKEEVQWLTW